MASIYSKFGPNVVSKLTSDEVLTSEEKAEQIEEAYQIHKLSNGGLQTPPAKIVQSKADEIAECWDSHIPSSLNDQMERDLDLRKIAIEGEECGVLRVVNMLLKET